MGVKLRYRGREVTDSDVVFIAEVIAGHPGASRRALSKLLCEAWDWRQANGELRAGERCSLCGKGKLCRHKPRQLIRLRGQAPIQATKWELERLRCNLCGEVFTAKAPAGVGEKKYDESAASMIGLLKYGSGMPFNRLARLEESFGIPLPVSTQWDIVAERTKSRPLPAAVVYP